MLLPRKWALSLGLLAAAPSLTMAGPLDLLKPRQAEQSSAAAAEAAAPNHNQQVANAIAAALSKEKLEHKDVSINVAGGVATISGHIKDAAQKALVTRVAGQIDGVKSVDNKLQLMTSAPTRPTGVQQAAAQQPAGQPDRRVRPINFQQPAASAQEVAQQIADALTAAGLSGYDIEVRYTNGTASLIGRVDDQEQVARAYQAASGVPGVQQVLNRLAAHDAGDIQRMPLYGQPGYPQSGMPPQAYQQMAMAQQAGYPAQAAPQGYPVQQTQAMAPAPVAAPPGGVQPAGHMIHNQPNIPPYAWPSYAPYDNYSAVTYPSMYDASAWPYIGPYYPYPQVPMGWRESTLAWDDGYWNLKFSSRTDRWWWFLNPKNWHDN